MDAALEDGATAASEDIALLGDGVLPPRGSGLRRQQRLPNQVQPQPPGMKCAASLLLLILNYARRHFSVEPSSQFALLVHAAQMGLADDDTLIKSVPLATLLVVAKHYSQLQFAYCRPVFAVGANGATQLLLPTSVSLESPLVFAGGLEVARQLHVQLLDLHSKRPNTVTGLQVLGCSLTWSAASFATAAM